MRGRGEHALAIAGTVNGKQVLTALSAGSSSKPSAVMPRVADRYGRGVDADGLASGPARLAVIADHFRKVDINCRDISSLLFMLFLHRQTLHLPDQPVIEAV